MCGWANVMQTRFSFRRLDGMWSESHTQEAMVQAKRRPKENPVGMNGADGAASLHKI